MLCHNDSFLFRFEAICCFPKRKKKSWGVGGGGGRGGGGANVRSLRLKNWLPLESTIIYKVVRS